MKRYYENKIKISNQQKVNYEKNGGKLLLQKPNNRFVLYKVLIRSYVELQNRLIALKENFSENHQN